MRRAHLDVGHMAAIKTLERVQEHFRWVGMGRDIWKHVLHCAPCAMPLPTASGLKVGADLSGPYPENRQGNHYLLSIIDHCTGYVEAKPLPNKSAALIYDYLSKEYIPRYSPPTVFLTDIVSFTISWSRGSLRNWELRCDTHHHTILRVTG